CDDGDCYVVKFQNNPQGKRILANEMLAGRLALALGLPVSEPEVVEVSPWLVEHSPEMYIQRGNDRVRCASGLQFGSRYPCDPLRSPVYDFCRILCWRRLRIATAFPRFWSLTSGPATATHGNWSSTGFPGGRTGVEPGGTAAPEIRRSTPPR
ncbi:MAG TPA: HipA family kinase, partial [Terriglobia bacterium]